jgi:hypothetical protein
LFNQNSNRPTNSRLPLILALVACVFVDTNLSSQNLAHAINAGRTTIVVGRVLAEVDHLTGFLRGSFGDRYEVFVFGSEAMAEQTHSFAPVKVMYKFYKSEQPLASSFYDYSNRYEMQVVREPSCDETVKSLSYEKNVDETGRPLPPTYVLRPLNGAPKHVLKLDATLPCYVLRPGKYKVLSAGKK